MGYSSFRITTLKPGKEINFTIYTKYEDDYMAIVEEGWALEGERIEKLKASENHDYYILEDHLGNYQEYLSEVMEETMASGDLSMDQKSEILEGAASDTIEKMGEGEVTNKSFDQAKKAAKSLRTMVQKNPSFIRKIFGKKASDSELIIKHSLNVCMLACKLGEVEGLSEEELNDLAAAALIHDLALANLKGEEKFLFTKPKKNFSSNQKKKYYTHTTESAEKIKNKKFVNDNVKKLVLYHEENLQGTGPHGHSKLTKSEEILSLVNCYDKKVVSSIGSPKEVFKDFQIDELGNYSLDLINNFKKVLAKEGLA